VADEVARELGCRGGVEVEHVGAPQHHAVRAQQLLREATHKGGQHGLAVRGGVERAHKLNVKVEPARCLFAQQLIVMALRALQQRVPRPKGARVGDDVLARAARLAVLDAEHAQPRRVRVRVKVGERVRLRPELGEHALASAEREST
jgi:hypothetical protein